MIHQKETKEKANVMRDAGKSYSHITKKLGVPKSTLSFWFNPKFRDVYKKRQHEHLNRARILAHTAIRNRIAARDHDTTKKVRVELKDYPLMNTGYRKTILAMLYWAEGSKFKNGSSLAMVNTYPVMLNLYITLLRNCYTINEETFWIRLHIHHYHDKNECLRFWSKILQIPLRRFAEPYVKPRSKTKKFRKNFLGICSIYCNGGNARRELLEIGRQLAGHYS